MDKASVWDHLGMLFALVFSAYLLLAACEVTTGQIIVPRAWWLIDKETAYCIYCSEKIDQSLQRVGASDGRQRYGELPFIDRTRTRFQIVLATEDRDALWDTIVGTILSLIAMAWFLLMVMLALSKPYPRGSAST